MNNYVKINEEEKYCANPYNQFSNKENQDLRAFITKTKQRIPCSIKPISCIIPRDINLKQIFIELFNSSFSIYDNNNIYIKLTQEQINNRRYVIESIKKFIISHRIKYKILYNIIYMFDILLCRNNSNKLISNLEKLGLGSAILMIKFMYEEFMMIPLNKFKSLYEKRYYTISQLQEIEINSLKLIDYYMNFPTPYSFMELLLLNGVVFSTDNIKNEISHKIYNLILITLEKIMLKSNEYVKYNPLYLCCGVVAYCREFYEIEKWPKILSKVFDVNERKFFNIYKEFFSPYNHHYMKSSNNISDKLINSKFSINDSKEKNDCAKNNQEKGINDININRISKDIHIYRKNNESTEKNNNYIQSLQVNNPINIRVNFKTSQEIRNCALFRKMNSKFNKNFFKKINASDNNNLKNGISNQASNEDNKNNQLNYDLNIYKSITSSKKPLTNIYKTPIKFENECVSSCFYKPNKKTIEYNLHQRNISNFSIPIQDTNINDISKNKKRMNSRDITIKKIDESDINNNEMNSINFKDKNETMTYNYRIKENRFIRKFNNKTNDEIKPKIEINEKEEIKVRVKDFYNNKSNNNSNNKEIQKHKNSFFNRFISTESDYSKKINEDNNQDKEKINHNNCITIIEPYKNNLLWKNNRSSIKIDDINSNNNNINRPSKMEYNYFNNISNINSNIKKITINRHSSCNEKYKEKGNNPPNKEEEYSNETTSENSYKCSIRRNYFKLKRLKDRLTNLNNENTSLVGNNLTNINKSTNKSISLIKYDLANNDKINNGVKSTKFKDCLRIGFSSNEKRIIAKNNEKEIKVENEKDCKSINHTKRYIDIRNFYKLKNINKNNNEEKNKEKNNNVSRNFIFQ